MRFVPYRKLASEHFEGPPDAEAWPETFGGGSAGSRRGLAYGGIAVYVATFVGLTVGPSPGLLELLFMSMRKHGALFPVIVTVLALVLLGVAHEAAHLVMQPDLGCSRRTLVGINGFGLFVLYNGAMSRRRYVLYLCGPLLVLSPLIVGGGYALGAPWPFVATLFVLHLTMAASDLAMLLRFVPSSRGRTRVYHTGRALLMR